MAVVSTRRSGDLLAHLPRKLSTASLCPVSHHAFDPDIRRMAKSQRFPEIEALLESRKLNLPADASSREPQLASSIISYASSGMLDHALRTLEDLPRLGSPRTLLSLNALLAACNHSKTLFRRVPFLLTDLSRRYSLSPDKISYGILIKSHCLARNASRALLILNEMDDKGIEITAVSYTTIIDSLYKENKSEEADRLWNEMRAKGVSPDLAAYNVRVMHRAKNGKPSEVLALMEEMKSAAAALEPDAFTYNYLMSCYCRHGHLGDAKRVYKELKEKGCRPNASTFKNLLHDLCKKNDFSGGLEVLEDSVNHGRILDLGSVLMLVKGLMKVSEMRAAKRVVSELRKKFPGDFSGSWKKLESVVGVDIEEVPEAQS